MSARVLIGLLLACMAPVSAETQGDPLTWLEGSWVCEAFGGTVEEVWLPPAGGVRHGVCRVVVDGELVFSEYMQVTVENGEYVMRFKHFRPDYSTWEGESPPLEFRATAATRERVEFLGVNEDSPGRIEYFRDGDVLRASVAGVDEVLHFRRR